MLSPISLVDKYTLLTNLFQFLWYIWDNTPEPNPACYDWRKIRPSQKSSSCPFQPRYLHHHGLKENRVLNSIEKNSQGLQVLRNRLVDHRACFNIPTMQFFIGISGDTQSKRICYHWLSVSGISETMYCGILITMTYCSNWITSRYIQGK